MKGVCRMSDWWKSMVRASDGMRGLFKAFAVADAYLDIGGSEMMFWCIVVMMEDQFAISSARISNFRSDK